MTAPIDPAWAEASARGWCDAWNRRDLEAVLAHYAADVEVRSPLVVVRLGRPDGVLRGLDELRGYFAIGMANPRLHFTFEAALIGVGAVCVLYRREGGRRAADTMELDADRKVRRMTACYGPEDAP